MNNTKQQNSYLGNNFMLLSIDTPAPVNYDMGKGVYGSYDGIRLIANKYDGWRKQPADVPLLKNKLFVPQGTTLPLANEMVYSQIPTDSMFYFARNQAKPECCPSTYSSSMGCACMCPEQLKYLNSRGGNRTHPSLY